MTPPGLPAPAGSVDAMRIDILSIFPELFEPFLSTSIPGRAREAGAASYRNVDIRSYTQDRHQKVDDRPFGGGPGMVMMCQPLYDAVSDIESEDPGSTAARILMTPQGRLLDQPLVEELAARPRLLIIAGRYEGIDERVIEKLEPMEISVGDYVTSGGELPAMLLIDAVVRLLPGVLGHDESAAQDSFSPTGPHGERLLDCPHYTRPRDWMGMQVPEVLISGDHGKVDAWRHEQRLKRTKERRPDLLEPPAPAAD